jgi:hypothetical protein
VQPCPDLLMSLASPGRPLQVGPNRSLQAGIGDDRLRAGLNSWVELGLGGRCSVGPRSGWKVAPARRGTPERRHSGGRFTGHVAAATVTASDLKGRGDR